MTDRRAHLQNRDLYRRFYDVDQWPGLAFLPGADEPRLIWALSHIGPTDNVVDIGCHKGEMTIAIVKKTDGIVFGVDISEKAIVEAREYARLHGLGILYGVHEAEHLPFGDNVFDVAVLTEILEHVVDPATVLAEAERVVRDGGAIVLSTPVHAIEMEQHEVERRDVALDLYLDMHVRNYVPEEELQGKQNLVTQCASITRVHDDQSMTFDFYLASYEVTKRTAEVLA